MERSEQIGFGVAVAAHVALFAVLAFGLVPSAEVPRRETVSVTLTDSIGEISTARDRPAPAARSSPERFEQIEPMPLPDLIPTPQPSIRPTPTPRPAQRVRPRERPRETARQPSGPVDRGDRRRPDRQERSSRLAGITEGISESNDTGTSSSDAPVGASEMANLASRIRSAFFPCYNLGALSGTAAEDIIVRLRLRPTQSGTISSGRVSIVGYDGINSSNREYQRQMGEAARSAVLNPRCPFPSLPDSMYENGWSDIVIRFTPG